MIMPQPFKNAVMTSAGAVLLTRVQAGEIRMEFTRIAVGSGAYTEEEKTFSKLQDRADLKLLKNSYHLSGIEVYSAHSVKVTALITNQDAATGECLVDEGYFINEMGLYAKVKDGGDDTEVLYSIAVTEGEHGDFMPPYNGFSPAQIIQEYYATVSNSAEVTIQTSGAFVLAQDFEAFQKHVEESVNRLEEKLQWLVGILCGYHYNRAQKKIVSLLPHEVKDGILTFPEGVAYAQGDKVVLRHAGAGTFPSFPGSSSPGGDLGGNTSGVGSMEEIAEAAAKIVEGNLREISPGQVTEMFRDRSEDRTGGETGDIPQTDQTDS